MDLDAERGGGKSGGVEVDKGMRKRGITKK